MHFAPGKVLSIVFEWLYLAILITCFVLSLGNRPQGSSKFYMSMVVFWAIIMAYVDLYTICKGEHKTNGCMFKVPHVCGCLHLSQICAI